METLRKDAELPPPIRWTDNDVDLWELVEVLGRLCDLVSVDDLNPLPGIPSSSGCLVIVSSVRFRWIP